MNRWIRWTLSPMTWVIHHVPHHAAPRELRKDPPVQKRACPWAKVETADLLPRVVHTTMLVERCETIVNGSTNVVVVTRPYPEHQPTTIVMSRTAKWYVIVRK